MLYKLLRAKARARWAAYGLVTLFVILLIIAAANIGPAKGGSFFSLFAEMILNTFVVLALIYLALAAFKRWQRHSGQARRRNLVVVESLRLSPKQTIHIVRVGERHLLVGASDAQLSLLTEVAAPPAAGSQASPPLFDGLLAQIRARPSLDPNEHTKSGSSRPQQLEESEISRLRPTSEDVGLRREGVEA